MLLFERDQEDDAPAHGTHGGRGRGGFDGGRSSGGFGRGRGVYDDGWYDDDRHHNLRHPKIFFPRYDGESDPLTWLTKCESYFRGMRTLDMEKVWLASLHLDGIAAQWYYTVERDHDIISWPRFADFVNLRFSPPIRTNALAELNDLYRTGSIEEY